MCCVWSVFFSFFSFLHNNYKPAKGIKSTLNAKKFYTIALPNYPRSFRCQDQTLSARPKFAGQMELQKLKIPGKMELRILDLGPRMELRIRPGAAFWELEIVNFFIFRLAWNGENVL